MDVVHDLVVFTNVWNDVDVKVALVGVQVVANVFHGERYWILNLLEVLQLLYLVVWELILCCY